jgi:hypothetical protein
MAINLWRGAVNALVREKAVLQADLKKLTDQAEYYKSESDKVWGKRRGGKRRGG